MKTVFVVMAVLLLTGCSVATLKSASFGNQSTYVDPLPIKTAIKNGSVFISVPFSIEKRLTTGYRSLFDLQVEIRFSKYASQDPVPMIPTGIVIGPRIRWRN